MKTRQWILCAVMEYDNAYSASLNKLPCVPFTTDLPDLSPFGDIANPNAFIAYPKDKSIYGLVTLMDTNRPLRNVILKAR